MSGALTEKEKQVIATMRMRLPYQQALLYLQEVGCPMKQSTYYHHRKKLEDKKLERLDFIARIGYEDQHLERIDQLELIQELMWQNYHLCKNHFQKTLILEKIANVQPYLSSYYDATKQLRIKQEHDL